MFKRITMIEGSSIDEGIVGQVTDLIRDAADVMVILDSNHTHEHVLAELELYAPMVKRGGYIAVMDTVVLSPGKTGPRRGVATRRSPGPPGLVDASQSLTEAWVVRARSAR